MSAAAVQPSRRRRAVAALVLALAAAAVAAFYARHVATRALPVTAGTLRAPGLQGRVEILRDGYGVPHIFAGSDEDAAFALGYVHAQDRLFQLEVTRHLAQGRVAEIFGRRVLRVDRLFRTLDLHGAARCLLARASAEARASLAAYARGINASVAALDGRLPPEFALLGRGFAPAQEDDFAGVVGYMTWGLNLSWTFDPLFERLTARVGRERALELFPWNFGGTPAVHEGAAADAPAPATRAAHIPGAEQLATLLERLAFTPDEEALLALAPSLRASNNWVVAPRRSATGHALLANDPHLAHGLPGIWYQAHLKSRTQDVIGVTLPGLPLVIIGHNRDVAWGFTNVMLDAADFFVERLNPEHPDEVLYRGNWVKLKTREEVLKVRGEGDVRLGVRETPHGPLVTDVIALALRDDAGLDDDAKAAEEAWARSLPPLAYRWTFLAHDGADDLDGFYRLNRARDWAGFRDAVSRFGVVAQNVAYADRAGHIGLQTTGAVPRLRGTPDGSGFRRGWDGSEEWDGFVPFEENPFSFDPPDGLLSSANNPTLPPGAPFYISSQWEPTDRITRIRERLHAKPKLSVADMQALQTDNVFVSARELTPLVVAAWKAEPVRDPRAAAAIELLRGWDGDMRTDSPAAALFAVFYRRLFHEIFADEMGAELARAYRRRANVSSIMMRAAVQGAAGRWLDRVDTPAREDRNVILREAFVEAVAELHGELRGEPASWTWGRLHTFELRHPIGRASPLLGWYFNRGPVPVPGHNATVNKMEFDEEDFHVDHGASMRQITDLGNLDAALAVLPGGQSGIPASPHYDDMLPLFLAGRYHPFPLDRAAVEPLVASRLVLEP